jgi:hypothetical protein
MSACLIFGLIVIGRCQRHAQVMGREWMSWKSIARRGVVWVVRLVWSQRYRGVFAMFCSVNLFYLWVRLRL